MSVTASHVQQYIHEHIFPTVRDSKFSICSDQRESREGIALSHGKDHVSCENNCGISFASYQCG